MKKFKILVHSTLDDCIIIEISGKEIGHGCFISNKTIYDIDSGLSCNHNHQHLKKQDEIIKDFIKNDLPRVESIRATDYYKEKIVKRFKELCNL